MQPSLPAGSDEQVFDLLMKNDSVEKNPGADQQQEVPSTMDFDDNDPLEQIEMKKSHNPAGSNNESNKAEDLNGKAENDIPNRVDHTDSISFN